MIYTLTNAHKEKRTNPDKAIMKLHTKQRCSNATVTAETVGNNISNNRFCSWAWSAVEAKSELGQSRRSKEAEKEKQSCDRPHFEMMSSSLPLHDECYFQVLVMIFLPPVTCIFIYKFGDQTLTKRMFHLEDVRNLKMDKLSTWLV